MNRDYIFDLLNQQIAKEQYAGLVSIHEQLGFRTRFRRNC